MKLMLMKKIAWLACGLSCAILVLGQAHAAYNATPDFWECANKVGGTFTHGRVPSGCDVNAFGPDGFVRGNYGTAIFNDAAYNTASSSDPISVAERKRYMQLMYPIIRDASARYLLARKPDVLADEMTAYQRGVFALLRQESFWSHYRDAQVGAGQDFLLKMVRGDSGHGHGMMQVDDRYHFLPLQEGKGWNMLQNFSYAIDIYYDGWKKAPASCLGNASSGDAEYWRSRARSAWSAYNGGPTKICRWQNAADANVAKDNGYRDNYDLRRWLPDVTDLTQTVSIDVACLMDNGSQCPLPVGNLPLPHTLLKIGSSACVLVDGKLDCVDDMRDAACLGSKASFDETQVAIVYAAAVTGVARTNHNRHQLCRAGVSGLQALGSAIMTSAALELRSAVGGMVIGSLPAGNYQVLDFEARGLAAQERFYRVRGASVAGPVLDGWIAAGDKNNFAAVAANTAPVAGGGVMAYPGDWVKVTPNLNLRRTPGDALTPLAAMPAGTPVQVKELYATASANNLYYRVEYLHSDGKLHDGWAFAGNLSASGSTLPNWFTPTTAANTNKPAHCPNGTRYDSQTRACVSGGLSGSVWGPFSVAATQACLDNGAGAVCTAQRGAVVDGVVMQQQIWSKSVQTAAAGNFDCAKGTARSLAHRFHCTESVVRNGLPETDVYGPFGSALVNACLAANGNAATCRANRWPASLFTALQP
jgi:hypothetical protein